MATMKLTDDFIRDDLQPPGKGNKIVYDTEVKGFGIRITAAGHKAFILSYTTRAGKERRYTIGPWRDGKTKAARRQAEELRWRAKAGADPLAELEAERAALHAERAAPTVETLAEKFLAEHGPGLSASTSDAYASTIRRDILPKLGKLKVADVKVEDVKTLYRAVSRQTPVAANRMLACISVMFNYAVEWGWRSEAAGNPARRKAIARNVEEPRVCDLNPDELARLMAALAAEPDRQAVDIVKLLLLTGSRKSEVLSMRWTDVDLVRGWWVKKASMTKQRRTHYVSLSTPAMQLLAELRAKAEKLAREASRAVPAYVFPGGTGAGRRATIKHAWSRIRTQAGLEDLHIHDLRHAHASMIISSGFTLSVVGGALGHSQPSMSQRYAHMAESVQREAAERVGAIVAAAAASGGGSGGGGGEVVPIGSRRRS